MTAANILMWISMAVFFGVSIYSILSILNKGEHYKASRTALIFSSGLILSIFIVRLGFIVNFSPENFSVEAIAEALLNTLQSFSMDGSYDTWLTEAANSAGNIFPENIWYYRLYTSVIYIAAPMTGGVILFEIIAGIFPHIKLSMASVWRFREILYFSELNRNSLALANSIKDDEKHKLFSVSGPIMVFTDVYGDKEEESSSELKLAAKAMGAICLDDDLLHIHIRKGENKKIFLIDENETENLRALTNLEKKYKRLEKTKIFLFSSDDMAIQIEQEVSKAFRNYYKSAPDEAPTVYIINSKRNLARNLLSEVPLYEPLIGRVNYNENYDLTVTVIGAGDLGTELFLSSYWYGQMLGCNLKINVISKETEQEFRNKIDNLNPDILKSSDRSDKILRIYPAKEETAEPYFEFKYYSEDITQYTPESEIAAVLSGSDYIVVAIGADENNIAAAEKIKREVSISKLSERQNKTVIAYVVFDPDLSRTYNNAWKTEKVLANGVYMHAFGSLDEVYGIGNVYLEAYANNARDIKDKYDILTYKTVEKESRSKNSEYDYWANISRAMHLKYKVFSVGAINVSVFSEPNDEKRKEKLNGTISAYKKIINDNTDLQNKLAWLEHRRWSAFMRINGFRCPEDFTSYIDITGSHKYIDLKLHPCLAECDKKGMKPDIFAADADREDFDYLDLVSLDIYNAMGGEPRDYKVYDYPQYDSLD